MICGLVDRAVDDHSTFFFYIEKKVNNKSLVKKRDMLWQFDQVIGFVLNDFLNDFKR